MSVTRDDIISEAMEMLKTEGLDALSLRKLAARLNISAPTLYWHVANKRELLDLVAERLVSGQRETLLAKPSPGQPWWEWLRVTTRELFESLIEIRDAPRVLAGNRPSLESLRHIDSNLGVLRDAGLTALDAQQTLFALGSYAIGSVVEWQGEADRERAEVRLDAQVEAAIRGEEYPHVSAAARGLAEQPPRATFEFGLDLIIAALRARYAPEAGKLNPGPET